LNPLKILSIIEALLFVVGEEGISLDQLAAITGESEAVLVEALDTLKSKFKESDERGLELVEVAHRYQFVTKQDLSDYIARLIDNPKPVALSQASLETLAIIAYKQPVSRAEVEEIRGVKSEKAIQTLVAKGLIKEVGRVEATGRAILYGVTETFLQHFGLRSLEELPRINTELDFSEKEEADLFYESFQQSLFE
jgi:segregation and condensation protein B